MPKSDTPLPLAESPASGEPLSVPELRIRAKRLLKQLRSSAGEATQAAATRFQQLESFASQSVDEIVERRDRVQLKHALTVFAVEQGHASWSALKAAREAPASAPPGREMYAPAMDVLLNRWFARYEDARESLAERGGYLLPFDRQFFVCESEGIRVLGLDPEDPDWQRIGWDWVRPRNAQAWRRLRQRRDEVLRASGTRT
ncbi:MAG: hypothetical protein AAF657_40600 [Acidobacteriota bacterium]